MGYKHLTKEQRYTIDALLQTPMSLREIGEVVDEKKRFGDFEIDTMIGKNRRGAIITTNDRCTHLVLIIHSRDTRRLRKGSMPSSTSHAHTTLGNEVQTRIQKG